jgi:hypothetical protein
MGPTRRYFLQTATATVAAGSLVGSAAAETTATGGRTADADDLPTDSRTGTAARPDGDDGRPPTVVSLAADTHRFWGRSVAADWSVADADGDLAAVETRLYAGRELLAVEQTDCRGRSASGIHSHAVGWFEDPTRVTLTVVDETKSVDTAAVDL